MTIAAGFVNDSGVLLCADTLVGDGQLSFYRSKLLGCPFQDGKALFGYSGDLTFSESAIQRCMEGFKRYNGKPRTIAVIVESIRKIWATAYRESFGNQFTSNQILLAVFSEAERDTALYHSANQALAQSTIDFECIGCGDLICKYFLGKAPWCGRGASVQHVFEGCIRACAHVKAAMPTAVGGNLIAANLTRDGELKLYAKQEIDWIENCSLNLAEISRGLAFSLTTFDDDLKFKQMLDLLQMRARMLRQEWLMERSLYPAGDLGFPPPEAEDLAYAFRPKKAAQ